MCKSYPPLPSLFLLHPPLVTGGESRTLNGLKAFSDYYRGFLHSLFSLSSVSGYPGTQRAESVTYVGRGGKVGI